MVAVLRLDSPAKNTSIITCTGSARMPPNAGSPVGYLPQDLHPGLRWPELNPRLTASGGSEPADLLVRSLYDEPLAALELHVPDVLAYKECLGAVRADMRLGEAEPFVHVLEPLQPDLVPV